jgi:hypothetical protein
MGHIYKLLYTFLCISFYSCNVIDSNISISSNFFKSSANNPSSKISFYKIDEFNEQIFLGSINCNQGEQITIPARPGRSTAPLTENYFIDNVVNYFPTDPNDNVFAGWCSNPDQCNIISNLTHYGLSKVQCPQQNLSLYALMLAPSPNWETITAGDLVVPNGVSVILEYAFQQQSITSVVLPDSLTSVDYYAFNENFQLTTAIIPDSVTSLNSAFINCGLTKVVIPNTVTTLTVDLFCNNALTELIIPNSVTSIEHYALCNNQLTSISIPQSVISIGIYGFGGNQFNNISLPNSVSSIGERAFQFNPITSIRIPSNITINHDETFGTNGASFRSYYDSIGKLEGTYLYSNGAWLKSE